MFKVSPSRGSDVLLEVLGLEFDGLLGCDYFSAYRKYMSLNENGRRWFERIATVVVTCEQQGRSVFAVSPVAFDVASAWRGSCSSPGFSISSRG